MKLHILSDLHLEFSAFDPPATDADVIVLAGDIDKGNKGVYKRYYLHQTCRIYFEQIAIISKSHIGDRQVTDSVNAGWAVG